MRSIERGTKGRGVGRVLRGVAALALALAGTGASAADLVVLSGGAVEAGVRPAVEAYERRTGQKVELRLATAPQMRDRLGGGESADVVIAPPAVLDALATSGRFEPAERRPLGSVGIGVVASGGGPAPDTSNVAALTAALLAADEVVFNRASTGIYLEALLDRTGLRGPLAGRIVRYPDGASVMEHVLRAGGRAIGFGAVTEILPYRSRGLRYAGPLPGDWQNRTAYVAAPGSATPPAPVRALLDALTGPDAAPLYVDAGIEPPR